MHNKREVFKFFLKEDNKSNKSSRAQAAIEHLAIAGFALIIFAIAIILYNHYSSSGQDTLITGQAEKVVNTLLAKADELASYDTGFTTYLTLDFPQGLEEVKLGTTDQATGSLIATNEVSLKIKTSKGDVSELAGATSFAKIKGKISNTPGLKTIGICALGEDICLVELQPGETCFDYTKTGKVCEIKEPSPNCRNNKLDSGEGCEVVNGVITYASNLINIYGKNNLQCDTFSCTASQIQPPTQPTCISPSVCKSSCSLNEQQTTDTCASATDKCCTPITVPTSLCANNILDTASGEQCDKVNNNILFNTNLGYDETRFTCDLAKCTATSKDWCVCIKSNVYPFTDDINPNIVTPIDWRTTIECKEKYECLVIYNNKKEECKQYQCDDLIYSNADVNKDAKITVEDVNIVTQCINKLFSYNWCTLTKTPVNLQAPVPKIVIDGTLEKSCECSAADVFNMQPSENVIDIYDTKTMDACISYPKQSWCTSSLEKRADVNRNGRVTNVDDEIVNYCVGKSTTTNWCSVEGLNKYDQQD